MAAGPPAATVRAPFRTANVTIASEVESRYLPASDASRSAGITTAGEGGASSALGPSSLVATAPLMLVVHPSLQAKSLKAFIALAKAHPGKFNFGSGGPGTTPHLAGEMLKAMAGLQMTHVPYKGGGPALADLMGGQLQLMLENIPSTLPHVKSGRLRALVVSGLKRSALVPDLPTLDEAGLKGYEIVGWNGLFLPGATPRVIVTRLHSETVKSLALPDIRERLSSMGAEGVGNTPAQFTAFLKSEISKWARVVRDAGLRTEQKYK